jgi:hypothetical protein
MDRIKDRVVSHIAESELNSEANLIPEVSLGVQN